MRFIKDADYEMQIRTEIKHLLDGYNPAAPSSAPHTKLLRAESAAIQQMRGYLAGRYDCNAIFTAHTTGDDGRNAFVVMTVIDLALYHLYSQTGNRDVPEHRKHRYNDALEWLKDAGRGDVTADLPSVYSETIKGDVRMWSRPPEDHTW